MNIAHRLPHATMALAALLMLSACNSTGTSSSLSLITQTSNIASVASELDSGSVVSAKNLGIACEVVAMTVGLTQLAVATGAVKSSPSVSKIIGIGNALTANPECVAALNGQLVSNPVAFTMNLIQFISEVRSITNGQVTAGAAASSTQPQVGAKRYSALAHAHRMR